jgi:OOP family OmpA-OmpF porin
MRRVILGAGAVALTFLAAICIPRHLPPSTASSPLTPASFQARLEQGTLTLRGSLPSEEIKASILQRAQELYGAAPNRIVNQLVVDSDVGSASWAGDVPKILPILGHVKERGSIMIDGRSIVLSGQVDDDHAKAAMLQDISPLRQSGLELEDHIVITQVATLSPSLQKKINEIISRGSIEFESNTTTILPRGRAILDQLIPLLRQSPTDKYGAVDYNFELSRNRAEAVRQYFIRHGLTNQFNAVGYGASRPLSGAGFQHNRRIELHVKGVSNQ